jgi:hypothetical protein
MSTEWTRNEKIGLGSLLATIIGAVATIAAIPDARQWFFSHRDMAGANVASAVPFARDRRIVGLTEQLRPLCDVRLTAEDLADLNETELEILRNSIFAFHGRSFSRKDLRELFARQTWYRVDLNYDDSRLSKIDWENIELIRRTEQARGHGSG